MMRSLPLVVTGVGDDLELLVPSGASRTTLMLAILKPTSLGDAFGDQLEGVTEHPVRASGERGDRARLSPGSRGSLVDRENSPTEDRMYAVATLCPATRDTSPAPSIALPRL